MDVLAHNGELTQEIKVRILTTNASSLLEDLYDLYASHTETRGLIALKKGLEPLAKILWAQENVKPQDDALAFIEPKLKVNSREEALAGARDIVAERIKKNKEAKKELKSFLKSHGSLNIAIIKENHPEFTHYKKYLNGSFIPLSTKCFHALELLDAESKGILSLSINVPSDGCFNILNKLFIKKDNEAGQHVRLALEDCYQRFLLPYLEMEIRTQLFQEAIQEAFDSRNNSRKPKKDLSLNARYFLLLPLIIFIFLTLRLVSSPDKTIKKVDNQKDSIKTEAQDKQLNGIIKKYYPNGQIMTLEGRLNGKRDGGFRKFLPNGQIVLFATYKNDVLDGEYREYYDNGKWKILKNYKAGQLEGLVKEYGQNGKLKQQTYYQKNRPIKKQEHE